MPLRYTLALTAAALLAAAHARAEPLPTLVAAYAASLAQQCGPLAAGAADPGLIDRVDLNADWLTDYVVDAGRYPFPGRPAISAAAGSQVTVLKGTKDGFE